MPLDIWDDDDETDEDSSTPSPDTAAGRKTILTQLAAAGGDLGKLAQDLLDQAEEREQRAADAEAATERLEALAASGETGLDDPDPEVVEQTKADLRTQVLAAREAADASVLAGVKKTLEASGLSSEDVQRQLDVYRDGAAQAAEWSAGTDPLQDSPVFIAHEQAKYFEQRAIEWAQNSRSNRSPGWDAEAEEARLALEAAEDELLAEAGVL